MRKCNPSFVTGVLAIIMLCFLIIVLMFILFICRHFLKRLISVCSGPNTAQLSNADRAKANVEGLEKGEYIFKLSVSDAEDLHNSTTVKVKVQERKFLDAFYMKFRFNSTRRQLDFPSSVFFINA